MLTAVKGTWRLPVDVRFQRQRNGVDIKGASNASKYELTAADKGAKITVVSTNIFPGTLRTRTLHDNPHTVR